MRGVRPIFDYFDRWIVYRTDTGAAVESAWDEKRADRSAGILNEHETRNGRPEVYGYRLRALSDETLFEVRR